jgi:hypothetical protein
MKFSDIKKSVLLPIINPIFRRTCLVIILLLNVSQLFSANDKYRLILTSDPATTITIGWNQISGSNPIVYYDTVDHGNNYSLYAFSKTVDRAVLYRGMDNRFVRLTNLKPNTAYYFVIHDSEGNSKRYWFKTAPDDLSRLSIIAGGDSRTHREPRQRANLLVAKLKPHAILFGGDMTKDDSDIQWQQWMDDWQYTIANDGRMFPIIPSQGNHESHEVIYNLFDTPNDTYYYTIGFGDDLFRIYTLNSEVSATGKQLTWLKNDLNANPNVIWKAAQYHRPMRPHYSRKPENETAYDAWAQLFFDKGVRLIVESDAHVVKETWPIEPSSLPGNDEGFIRNDTYGCVYVGEGGWGAPLYKNDDDKSWTRNSGLFYQFKLIFIDTSKIEIRTIKTDNANDVGEVSNDDPFTLPSKLDVWNPSNGSVVTIHKAPPMNKPDIKFADNTPVTYANGNNITLNVDVLDAGDGIDNVSFYIYNKLAEVVNTPPYTFNHSYADGQYLIDAVAVSTDGLKDRERLSICVGKFTKNGEIAIKNGQDDVEETEAGRVYFNSSDLEMVYDGYDSYPNVPNGYQKIGLRFQDVFIPSGAIIDNAYIQFRSDETNNASAELLISAEDTDNAAPFDNSNTLSVSGRTTFPNSVYWTPPAWSAANLIGPAQRTPDVSGLLQQIIDRKGWKSGNNIVFKIEGTGVSLTNHAAKRVADSYEGSHEHPATLIYTFHFNSGTAGINNEKLNTDSYVYPNPFNKTLHFYIPSVENHTVIVQITDILGKLLLSEPVTILNNKFTLNPAIQEKGVYIVVP